MTDIEQVRVRWIKERPTYQSFGSHLQTKLTALLKPLGMWFEVTSRAKEIDSLVKKLIRKPAHNYDSLPDKVGVRVVLRYRSDIRRVIEVVKRHFDSQEPDYKLLRKDQVGYQSVHLDFVRFRETDASAGEYPPAAFWAELQVRTFGQHLWSEMSHDSVYKSEPMLSALPEDVERRVNLMAGQIEVADREFDRLNSELSSEPPVQLLQMLEKHYYTLTARRPDLELSLQLLNAFMPLVGSDVQDFANRLNDFLTLKHAVLETVYAQAFEAGLEHTTSFIFQPEVLMLYKLLSTNPDATRRLWNSHYPEPELERIANAFGISFD